MNLNKFENITLAYKNNAPGKFLNDIIDFATKAQELLNSKEYQKFVTGKASKKDMEKFDKKYIKFVRHFFRTINPCDTHETEWENKKIELEHIKDLTHYQRQILDLLEIIEENYNDEVENDVEYPYRHRVNWDEFTPEQYYKELEKMENLGLTANCTHWYPLIHYFN